MTQKTQWSTIVKFFGRKLFENEIDDSSNNCDETSHWNEKKQRCVPIIDHPQLVDGSASAAQNLSKEASTASKEAFAQEIPKKRIPRMNISKKLPRRLRITNTPRITINIRQKLIKR